MTAMSVIRNVVADAMARWHGDYNPNQPPLAQAVAEAVVRAIEGQATYKLAGADWTPANDYSSGITLTACTPVLASYPSRYQPNSLSD